MKPERVVITGGLGFIGSTVTEYMLEKGSEVTVVDSLLSNVLEPSTLISTYNSANVVETTIAEYLANGTDIADFDLLIHAASFVGPASILQYQGTIGQEIVSDTSRIIKSCLKADVPLIYFSSAEVYGKSGILREGSDIRVPPYYNARIEYALAKLTSEAMVINSRNQGLNGVVIRPFNVAGPRQSRAGGFVMPTFVQQALGNKPITVFGTGKQKRAFLGASDLANFLANYISDGMLTNGSIYNIGNPANATTIEDLARKVVKILDSQSEITYMDPKSVYGPLYYEAESFEKLPDIKNARKLGWEPKKTLEDIILETASYYRNNQDTRGADARN
jgi:nucleoside-diphosphate-sugar epimerase